MREVNRPTDEPVDPIQLLRLRWWVVTATTTRFVSRGAGQIGDNDGAWRWFWRLAGRAVRLLAHIHLQN